MIQPESMKAYQAAKSALFAEDYKRDDKGRILFPRDTAYRNKLNMTKDMRRHPTMNNLYLIEELIKYTSNPGDTVMDIMVGSGSILIGALMDRTIMGIEKSEFFVDAINEGVHAMGLQDKPIYILQGDCQTLLPMVGVQSIIFSPPYAKSFTSKSMDEHSSSQNAESYALFTGGDDRTNLGMMSDFMYNQSMEEIYRLCYESLVPGGYLSVIIRDHVVNGPEMTLTMRAMQLIQQSGLEYVDWFKRYVEGSTKARYNRKMGYRVVDEESAIVFRRLV
jgi:tRNA1(Val) A37 N6-methylase TrmN6